MELKADTQLKIVAECEKENVDLKSVMEAEYKTKLTKAQAEALKEIEEWAGNIKQFEVEKAIFEVMLAKYIARAMEAK